MSSPAMAIAEELDAAECLRLISPGGVGRIGFTGEHGLTVLPVNYRVTGGVILFRAGLDSAVSGDLRTGIAGAEYRVAFEVDALDEATRTGWSVLVRGPAHHVGSAAGQAAARAAGVEPWPGGEKGQFIRITPVPGPRPRLRPPARRG